MLLCAVGAKAQAISYSSANCTGSASAAAASCTLVASGSVGDLMVVITKAATVTTPATVALTFSGTASCASPTQVITPTNATWQTNGGADFILGVFGCIITTGGATTPTVTWTGTSNTFTDITVGVYHTTSTWLTTFTDQTAQNISATTSTTCPTGTTAATTNATDLIIAVCTNFNVGETWGALAGFTNRAGSSRNTTGWYDSIVSSTGTQTANVPLSTTDFGLGVILAFASNSGGAVVTRGKAVIF